MRLNKFLAQASGLSRRAADAAIQANRVTVNGRSAKLGDTISESDTIQLDNRQIEAIPSQTIMLNKPRGYVCSRRGQGSRTIYDLLPADYHRLKPVGRLDKDSSGLLLLTDDGDLANQLLHPRYAKVKLYEVSLDKALVAAHQQLIAERGIQLDDGPSRFSLAAQDKAGLHWRVTMREGRKRQIRRTFTALGYEITALHRTHFGDYRLGDLPSGQHSLVHAP